MKVIDLHEDIAHYFLLHGAGLPLDDFALDISGRDADIPKYLRVNVKLVFASIFPATETLKVDFSRRLRSNYGIWVPAFSIRFSWDIFFEQLAIYHRIANSYEEIKIVRNFEDVKRVVESEKRIGFLLHLEGSEILKEPDDLIFLKQLGIRSLGISWNYDSKYCAGCLSKKDYGLTSEGERLVSLANEAGIIIDVAHASKKTTLDVLSISKKPVFITHTNIRRLTDHPRNVDDEILEALQRNRGVLGISAVGPFVAARGANLDHLVNHFTYVYENFGSDLLAIGTDFFGLSGLPVIKDFESIDKIPRLVEKLLDRGVKEKDIEKILYKNALKVIESNFKK